MKKDKNCVQRATKGSANWKSAKNVAGSKYLEFYDPSKILADHAINWREKSYFHASLGMVEMACRKFSVCLFLQNIILYHHHKRS
jgi:hypothetical protein